jgi:hypothetical protein
MKKRYICPVFNIEDAQAAQMLAESLPIIDDNTVDGGNALTKDSAWDVWGGDDNAEE